MDQVKFLLSVLILFGVNLAAEGSSSRLIDGKINIHVYYESQCPDSQLFINNQIDRALEKFSSLVNFILVPFGSANVYIIFLNFFNVYIFWLVYFCYLYCFLLSTHGMDGC